MTEYSAGFQQPLGPGGLPLTPSADILDGYATFTANAAATTVLTVPAGRTWSGVITLTCSTETAAAGTTTGQAYGIVSTAGAGVVPAAGSYMECQALSGANVAGGTVGVQGNNAIASPFIVVAPAGNAVTIQITIAATGAAARVGISCIGLLL